MSALTMMTKVVVVFENCLFQETWIGTMFLGAQLLTMIRMVAKVMMMAMAIMTQMFDIRRHGTMVWRDSGDDWPRLSTAPGEGDTHQSTIFFMPPGSRCMAYPICIQYVVIRMSCKLLVSTQYGLHISPRIWDTLIGAQRVHHQPNRY